MVVASSSSVYGANPALPKHEGLVPMPVSPYAVSKLATEAYALAHAASFGIGALAFRFFNVFGPLQTAGHAYAAVVPAFVAAALAGEPVTVHGDGGQTRDFTYIGSVCEVLVGRRARPGHQRPAGEPGLRRAARRCSSVLDRAGGDPRRTRSSATHVGPRPGDVRDSQADQTNLRALFPARRAGRARRGAAAHGGVVPHRRRGLSLSAAGGP